MSQLNGVVGFGGSNLRAVLCLRLVDVLMVWYNWRVVRVCYVVERKHHVVRAQYRAVVLAFDDVRDDA